LKDGKEGAWNEPVPRFESVIIGQNLEAKGKQGKGRCIPKMDVVLEYEISSTKIGKIIQHMTYHIVIGNFMGIWPSEKALEW
jgi:hypothetical protein